jgi:hypothetical protein
MDKFKMELTWHNCKTCPPKEYFNANLLVTDGYTVHEMVWDSVCGGFFKAGFIVTGDKLEKYWWADVVQTVNKTSEFKEAQE